ncbi:MAG: NifB/NifX family molybdenum-iron cluster-binding protein [Bradyrhizobium sp.]|nr:NifB/NifX family molybdenum-iron cluster-binding protein [Bradyrhizobium sp.]
MKVAFATQDLKRVDAHFGWAKNIAIYDLDPEGYRFVETVDRARENRVLAAARWTNLMLQPPSEAMGRLIFTMAQNRALCDEFTDNFNYPERQWDRLASDRRIHAWIDERTQLAA